MPYLEKGVVQFKGLSIDKAGVGYRLTYAFLQYEDERLHETSMQTHGESITQFVKHRTPLLCSHQLCVFPSQDHTSMLKLVHHINSQSYSIHREAGLEISLSLYSRRLRY